MGIFSSLSGLASLFIPGAKTAKAVGLLGGIGDDLLNSHQADSAMQKQLQANLALAKYQNDYNTEMWNKQNEYNSPINQRQRLIDAGLNPNIMYGNGGVMNTSSTPHAAASVAAPDYLSKFQMQAAMVQADKTRLENSLYRAQANKLDAEAEEIRARKNKQDTEASYTLTMQDQQQLRNDILAIDKRIKQETADYAINIVEEEWKGKKLTNDQKYKFIHEQMPVVIAGLEKQNQLTDENIKNAIKERSRIVAATQELFTRAGLNQAKAREAISNVSLNMAKEMNLSYQDQKIVGELNMMGTKLEKLKQDIETGKITQNKAREIYENLQRFGAEEPGKLAGGFYGPVATTVHSVFESLGDFNTWLHNIKLEGQ